MKFLSSNCEANFEKENAQLRRELEALRINFSDALVLIGDLRQELRKR